MRRLIRIQFILVGVQVTATVYLLSTRPIFSGATSPRPPNLLRHLAVSPRASRRSMGGCGYSGGLAVQQLSVQTCGLLTQLNLTALVEIGGRGPTALMWRPVLVLVPALGSAWLLLRASCIALEVTPIGPVCAPCLLILPPSPCGFVF